jgi:RNA polymerase sigma-70 factor (ECF subfamily)
MSGVGESDLTCWTVIRGAAEGGARDREQFVRRYAPVIRAYLLARWRGGAPVGDLDDAMQEVFLDCFRDGGALTRAEPRGEGSFHAFLFGVVRNVARRFERERAKAGRPLDSSFDEASGEPSPSDVFDRAWAKSLVRQAAARQELTARQQGPDAVRRVDVLRLRFQEGLPIRDIARRWDEDPARLHHEYARARKEFLAALREVVKEHYPDVDGRLDAECSRLLSSLR